MLDPLDAQAVSFVFERQDHRAWEFVRPAFEAIPLDSDYAKMMMRSASRDAEARVSPDESHAALVALTNDLSKAREGDSAAFWRLVWNLQIDPEIGEGRTFTGDDITQFPGMRALECPVDDFAE